MLDALVAGPRHVRTPEGSRLYGQPIGAVITKDIIERAKRLAKLALPGRAGGAEEQARLQLGRATQGGTPADRIRSYFQTDSMTPDAKTALAGFDARTFQSDQQAGQYALNHSDPTRFGAGGSRTEKLRTGTRSGQWSGATREVVVSDSLVGFHEAQRDLRAGKVDSPEAKQFIARFERYSAPTTDDLVVSRRVGMDAFGEGGVEGLVGHSIHDEGFYQGNLGTPIGEGPVLLTVAVPKGTRAMFPGNGPDDRGVVLDRGQRLHVTKVTPDGKGGWYVAAVATPGGRTEKPLRPGAPGKHPRMEAPTPAGEAPPQIRRGEPAPAKKLVPTKMGPVLQRGETAVRQKPEGPTPTEVQQAQATEQVRKVVPQEHLLAVLEVNEPKTTVARMREIAREKGIKVPTSVIKKADIREHLIRRMIGQEATPEVPKVPKPRTEIPVAIKPEEISDSIAAKVNDPKTTILQLRHIATEHHIRIPTSMTKKADIKAHILREGGAEGKVPKAIGRVITPDTREAFHAAWTKEGIKAPEGPAQRELNEVFLDVRGGKLSLDEGSRRLETSIDLDREELARTREALKGDVKPGERGQLERQAEKIDEEIKAKQKAVDLLRGFGKGKAVVPKVRPESMPDTGDIVARLHSASSIGEGKTILDGVKGKPAHHAIADALGIEYGNNTTIADLRGRILRRTVTGRLEHQAYERTVTVPGGGLGGRGGHPEAGVDSFDGKSRAQWLAQVRVAKDSGATFTVPKDAPAHEIARLLDEDFIQRVLPDRAATRYGGSFPEDRTPERKRVLDAQRDAWIAERTRAIRAEHAEKLRAEGVGGPEGRPTGGRPVRGLGETMDRLLKDRLPRTSGSHIPESRLETFRTARADMEQGRLTPNAVADRFDEYAKSIEEKDPVSARVYSDMATQLRYSHHTPPRQVDDLVTFSESHGWRARSTRGEGSDGRWVRVELANPKTGDRYEVTWHADAQGNYKMDPPRNLSGVRQANLRDLLGHVVGTGRTAPPRQRTAPSTRTAQRVAEKATPGWIGRLLGRGGRKPKRTPATLDPITMRQIRDAATLKESDLTLGRTLIDPSNPKIHGKIVGQGHQTVDIEWKTRFGTKRQTVKKADLLEHYSRVARGLKVPKITRAGGRSTIGVGGEGETVGSEASYIRSAFADAADHAALSRAVEEELRRLGNGNVIVNLGPAEHTHLPTAREHMEGILRAHEQWPETDLSTIGSFNDPTDMAWARTGRGKIRFNLRYSGNEGQEQYRHELRESTAGWDVTGFGFHPRGGDTPTATAIHEYGHLVQEGIEDKLHPRVLTLLRARAKAEGIPIEQLIGRDISLYALGLPGMSGTDRMHELVSEALQDYMINGSDSSRLSQEIAHIVREEYRRRHGRTGLRIPGYVPKP